MTSYSPLARLGPDRGTMRIWEGCYRGQGRLYISFYVHDDDDFTSIMASFRSHFPRHGDALYNKRMRCWSLPLTHTRRLYEWAERHFEELVVHEGTCYGQLTSPRSLSETNAASS